MEKTNLEQLNTFECPCAAGVQVYRPPQRERAVYRLVRTAAATVMWLPVKTYRLLVRSSGRPAAAASPLGEAALSALLILAHYPDHASSSGAPSPPMPAAAIGKAAARTDSDGAVQHQQQPQSPLPHSPFGMRPLNRVNPLKRALRGLQDGVISGPSDAEGVAILPQPAYGRGVAFSALYDSFCNAPFTEDRVLLLYAMLHGCRWVLGVRTL